MSVRITLAINLEVPQSQKYHSFTFEYRPKCTRYTYFWHRPPFRKTIERGCKLKQSIEYKPLFDELPATIRDLGQLYFQNKSLSSFYYVDIKDPSYNLLTQISLCFGYLNLIFH